jgi:hypothetical protein
MTRSEKDAGYFSSAVRLALASGAVSDGAALPLNAMTVPLRSVRQVAAASCLPLLREVAVSAIE